MSPAPYTLIIVLAASCCVYRKKSVLSHKWYLPSENVMLYSGIGYDIISRETRLGKKWPQWKGWNKELLLQLECLENGNRKISGTIDAKYPSFLPKHQFASIQKTSLLKGYLRQDEGYSANALLLISKKGNWQKKRSQKYPPHTNSNKPLIGPPISLYESQNKDFHF